MTVQGIVVDSTGVSSLVIDRGVDGSFCFSPRGNGRKKSVVNQRRIIKATIKEIAFPAVKPAIGRLGDCVSPPRFFVALPACPCFLSARRIVHAKNRTLSRLAVFRCHGTLVFYEQSEEAMALFLYRSTNAFYASSVLKKNQFASCYIYI